MPDFLETFDTSGFVIGEHAEQVTGECTAWRDLDAFTQGYVEALFFTNQSCIDKADWHLPESQERVREGQADGDLPRDAGFADLAPETLRDILADCKQFCGVAMDSLCAAYLVPGYGDEQAGRDFWFTRNHHGAGFWDRELGEVGDRLTDVAHGFGETDAYFGDDGKVYLT